MSWRIHLERESSLRRWRQAAGGLEVERALVDVLLAEDATGADDRTPDALRRVDARFWTEVLVALGAYGRMT